MKKTRKPGAARTLVKKAPALKKSMKPKPGQVLSQTDLLMILERIAESAERLARAAEQMAAAAAQSSRATESEREVKPLEEEAGEVVGMMVVDEGEEE